ncbi:MAG: PIN domain-containing protein [Flavobacteriales bacterium]|nr:PIN domain-containing protein [Flavobacteriales bacterium]
MKYLFLDTNVLMDLLKNMEPFVVEAEKLMKLVKRKRIRAFISSTCYTDLYYLMRKSSSHNQTISALTKLESMTTMISLSRNEVLAALSSNFSDFEDAVQHACAVSGKKIEAIVTRDKKGFKKSLLPVLSPTEALAELA